MKHCLIKFACISVGLALVLSGCLYTRHKKGNDAFEHYFGFSPPAGVTLIHGHWAGLYYPFGLDAEKALLEFSAPPDVINHLFEHDPKKELAEMSVLGREKIFGWQTTEVQGVTRGIKMAPTWFRPNNTGDFHLTYGGEDVAIIRFQVEKDRFEMVLYGHGSGYIFLDRIMGRAFITQFPDSSLF